MKWTHDREIVTVSKRVPLPKHSKGKGKIKAKGNGKVFPALHKAPHHEGVLG